MRFLWNRLLDREKAEYAASQKSIWRKDLQPAAVAMKRQDGLEWLANPPAHAVLDSVAGAGMSRLVTFCEYKADWQGRRVEKTDRWFPASQTRCKCTQIQTEMKNLGRRVMVCTRGNWMRRDQNAAVDHCNYDTSRNRAEPAAQELPTRVEIGDQGSGASRRSAPVSKTRILAAAVRQ